MGDPAYVFAPWVVAAAVPGFEAYWGLQDLSAYPNGTAWFFNADARAVGINAAVVVGTERFASGSTLTCYVFVYGDSGGWHFLNGSCPPGGNKGYVPGPQDRVFVSGCANVRDAPGLSGKIVGCLPSGTVVDVDNGLVYYDGHIWWHLAGRGWMAHDYLVAPRGTP